jgi:Rrf2 family protein
LSGLDNGGRAPTSHIAREKQIPPSFLAKIVSQLSVAGVVQTSRGARGGVSLARPAEDISLLEVIEAIDGPITLNECVADSSACTFGDECPVHSIWCETHDALVGRLKSTNFESLASADSNGRVK